MLKKKKVILIKYLAFAMICLGFAIIVDSMFTASTFLSITGLAFVFWAIILFYLTPVKYVPLYFLSSVVGNNMDNIERIIFENDLTEKGIYLPPKYLKNVESSIVFVPRSAETPLPTSEEITGGLLSKKKDGVYITPPGYFFSKQFEAKTGRLFSKIDFLDLQVILPKLLIREFEIAEDAEISFEKSIVTVTLTNNIFAELCKPSSNQPRSNSIVGGFLDSTLACILAKTLGKPIIIKAQIFSEESNKTIIEYQVEES